MLLEPGWNWNMVFPGKFPETLKNFYSSNLKQKNTLRNVVLVKDVKGSPSSSHAKGNKPDSRHEQGKKGRHAVTSDRAAASVIVIA